MQFQTVIVDDCFYDKKVLGCNFIGWLSENIKDYIVLKNENEILECNIKSDYFLVLHTSYPLLKYEDICYIADYAINKNLTICNFNGGFFVKKNYYFNKKSNNIVSSDLHFDYSFCVNNNMSLQNAKDVLRRRIIENHINNGVSFCNINTVVIDKFVVIQSGVVIPNCCEIYGNSFISCDAKLESYKSYVNVNF